MEGDQPNTLVYVWSGLLTAHLLTLGLRRLLCHHHLWFKPRGFLYNIRIGIRSDVAGGESSDDA